MELNSISSRSVSTFINPYSYRILRAHPQADRIFNEFNIKIDGFSLVVIHNLLHERQVKRESFDDTSLAPLVFDDAMRSNKTVGIIGSSKSTIERAAIILSEKYGVTIKEKMHGYFSEGEALEVKRKFLNCDLVICSMGTPMQETFILELQEMGWSGCGYTCGGYFDQLVSSNGGDYYPRLVNAFNLRWAYRIYKEPRRLWRRYLISYPHGIVLYIFDALRGRVVGVDGVSRKDA